MWSIGFGLSGNILPERESKPNSASESDSDSASDSDSDSDSELQAFSHQEKLHTGTSIMGNPDSDSESDSASDADSDSDSELQTFSHQEKLHTGQLPSIMGKSGTESRNNKLYDWGLCDYGGPRGLMWSLGLGLSGNILPERERKPNSASESDWDSASDSDSDSDSELQALSHQEKLLHGPHPKREATFQWASTQGTCNQFWATAMYIARVL